MQRIVPAIVLTSLLAVVELGVDMLEERSSKAISTLFNVLHKVFTQTTMCAFIMHLHFNHQHLGKLYGLTCAVSAVIAAFQFPVWTFLVKKYSMLPAHVLLLILSLVSFVHALNTWDHCRKRLVLDQSDHSSERSCRPNHNPPSVHIETDDINLPSNKNDVSETNKVMFSDVNHVKEIPHQNSVTMEMSAVGGRNGQPRVILETSIDDDEPVVKPRQAEDEYDEEEEEVINSLDLIRI
ncbi:equilibrative nucleobase transporter 1-like [Physella acuta]|uniref:equilibrative nucleobase transporter 1-like n=1 Tax=Physella acuta TaxID=109671 RepID=UPI0027DE1CE9|nr:equilibrative nucleobase transporter 1-like [Physella acuta]